MTNFALLIMIHGRFILLIPNQFQILLHSITSQQHHTVGWKYKVIFECFYHLVGNSITHLGNI